MGRTLEDLLYPERFTISPYNPAERQADMIGLTGDNARMMSNPEDRRQFRSGNGQKMYYKVPPQPAPPQPAPPQPAPPLSEQNPSWWDRIRISRQVQSAPIPTPVPRELTAEEEATLPLTREAQLRILNRPIN